MSRPEWLPEGAKWRAGVNDGATGTVPCSYCSSPATQVVFTFKGRGFLPWCSDPTCDSRAERGYADMTQSAARVS